MIFDVLRYPITDIYNNHELANLPVDLYNEWISECNNCLKFPITDKKPTISTIVYYKTHDAMASSSIISSARSAAGWHALWTAYFTLMLKNMIKDYEPKG
jgi:hypothetical protein